MVSEIKSVEEFNEVKSKTGKVILIDFYANWCGNCKKLATSFPDIEKEFPNVEIYKVDVDENEDLAEENEIEALPTCLVFKDGKQVHKYVGSLLEKLKPLLV